MSFFNFRRAGASSAAGAAPTAQTESVETIRKRAKHRLIGSAVLVLAGIVGFPLLFDTQPRPIAMDIPIEIPNKNKVAPPVSPAATTAAPAVVAAAPSATSAVTPSAAVPAKPVTPAANEKVAAAASLDAKEEIITDKKPAAPAPSAQSAIKIEAKPVPKPEVKPEPKPVAKPVTPPAQDDGARARALLEGQSNTAASVAKPAAADSNAAASSSDMRLIVQVGAFADVVKAREVRMKLEKAGFKTYTQVAETTAGKRIRVRVGPFATKAEADKAASKIKSLDLQAAILTL